MIHLTGRRAVLPAFAGTALLLFGGACSARNSNENLTVETPPVVGLSTTAATPTTATNTSVRASDQLSTTELVERTQPSVVRIASRTGVGSGFIVDPAGYIVTNYHVIEGGTGSLEVTLADGSVLSASVVGSDQRSDLAVIKVEPRHDLPVLPLAKLRDVHVGDDVLAIGFALDLASGHGDPSVTRGIVSGKNRTINDSGILGAVQTDAAINHGNSGGPLVNYRGEVVGVNTALAPDTGSDGLAQNVGFAVGSDTVAAVYDEIRQTGRVTRGYLGIADFSAIRPAEAELLRIPAGQAGLLVPDSGVAAGGPADAAGLRGRDVIVEIDGAPIADPSDLWVAMIRHNPGDAVSIGVYRDGSILKLTVTLGNRAG